MSKVLIDGRFIGVGDSISRVTLGLLGQFLKLDKENQYSLLIRPAGVRVLKEFGFWDREDLRIEVLDIPHYSVAEQTKLFIWLNKKPYDLVFFTQFNHPIRYRKPFVVAIHDMTTFGYFHYQNPAKVAVFKAVMRSAVKNSKKILTPSENSKKEIIDHYKIDSKKIKVMYLGIYENYLRISKLGVAEKKRLGEKFKKEYKISGDYFLYTGMWKKHKNLVRMLKAFEQVVKSEKSKVKSSRIQLVLVGKIDQNEPEVIAEIERINYKIQDTRYNNQKNSKLQIPNYKLGNSNYPIIAVGFVPEEFLPAAYAGALAYVQPSLNEGFGWPPLEAMACGTPVIASNVSATPEILGDAALYFDPYNENDIAKKMSLIVDDFKLRLDLQKKGLEQIKNYSWQKTAEIALKVINEVLK